MAMAITNPILWIKALDVLECARQEGRPVPEISTRGYQVELAQVVLLLASRAGALGPRAGEAARAKSGR